MPIRQLTSLLFLILFAAAPVLAQEAVVQTAAPIFLLPDTTRVPLRTAAPNTRLRVIEEGPEGWVKVEFQDPQFGPRTGYIQATHITIRRPELEPMDLSIRKQESPPATAPQAPAAPAQSATQRPHTREGTWFSIGLGLGSIGCDGCDVRSNGVSGGLSVGSAITDRFMLGVGTTGYSRTIDGDLLTVGTVDGRIRFYFTNTGGGHLNFGMGLGTLSYAGETEVGLGLMFGLGWDFRIGRNVSITPFWNGFAMNNSNVDANVGQLGIGFTWH
jgi:hypothetical protein